MNMRINFFSNSKINLGHALIKKYSEEQFLAEESILGKYYNDNPENLNRSNFEGLNYPALEWWENNIDELVEKNLIFPIDDKDLNYKGTVRFLSIGSHINVLSDTINGEFFFFRIPFNTKILEFNKTEIELPAQSQSIQNVIISSISGNINFDNGIHTNRSYLIFDKDNVTKDCYIPNFQKDYINKFDNLTKFLQILSTQKYYAITPSNNNGVSTEPIKNSYQEGEYNSQFNIHYKCIKDSTLDKLNNPKYWL